MKTFQKEAYSYIKDMFVQHNIVKRIILSLISILIMGFGISLFSVSGFGVDPFTSMNMNIAAAMEISFGTFQLLVNLFLIVFVVIVAHRGLVGPGTLFNMVGVGYVCQFFQNRMEPMSAQYDLFTVRIILLAAGLITLCLACSLFFTANVGVGPYDSISFMLSGSIGAPHKWVRVMTDITVILIGLIASGGIAAVLKGDFSQIKNIGIGTVITAFFMGPLVHFFNRYVSAKILNVHYDKVGKDIAFFMISGAMKKNLPLDLKALSKRGENGLPNQAIK